MARGVLLERLRALADVACAGWAPNPWAAVQQAARDALAKLESGETAPRDWTLSDDAPV